MNRLPIDDFPLRSAIEDMYNQAPVELEGLVLDLPNGLDLPLDDGNDEE